MEGVNDVTPTDQDWLVDFRGVELRRGGKTLVGPVDWQGGTGGGRGLRRGAARRPLRSALRDWGGKIGPPPPRRGPPQADKILEKNLPT